MSDLTALVTGASDGIGADFARSLARRGYQLILVARREDKLQEIAVELTANFGTRCTVLPSDLSVPGAAVIVFDTVKNLGLEVDFLVNNAGLLFNGPFIDLPRKGQENLLMVNMVALTSLSHLFAKEMANHGTGHILNVASLAAWMPIPNENVYAASKAYVLSFTLALAEELKAARTGVVATALCPGYTATKMLNNPDQGGVLKLPAGIVLPSDLVAEQGIAGCLAGKNKVMPGFSNRISATLLQLLPKSLVTRLVGNIYRKNMF